MAAEEPLNFITVILAVRKEILFIRNKSNKIRIRFLKYWTLIDLFKFEVEVCLFYKKNGQKLAISWTIFTISKNP